MNRSLWERMVGLGREGAQVQHRNSYIVQFCKSTRSSPLWEPVTSTHHTAPLLPVEPLILNSLKEGSIGFQPRSALGTLKLKLIAVQHHG